METLLVTFASFTNPARPASSPALFNSIQRLQTGPDAIVNFDIRYLLANENDWYLSGVRGLSDGLVHSAQDIRAIAEKYSKVIFVGNSMGGYAALHFGALCGADRVIAFAPQVRIDGEFHLAIQEQRWSEAFARLRKQWGRALRDVGLDLVFEETPSLPSVDIYVGRDCPQDIANAEILSRFGTVVVHKVDEVGHDVALFLKENGKLDALLRAALC